MSSLINTPIVSRLGAVAISIHGGSTLSKSCGIAVDGARRNTRQNLHSPRISRRHARTRYACGRLLIVFSCCSGPRGFSAQIFRSARRYRRVTFQIRATFLLRRLCRHGRIWTRRKERSHLPTATESMDRRQRYAQ